MAEQLGQALILAIVGCFVMQLASCSMLSSETGLSAARPLLQPRAPLFSFLRIWGDEPTEPSCTYYLESVGQFFTSYTFEIRQPGKDWQRRMGALEMAFESYCRTDFGRGVIMPEKLGGVPTLTFPLLTPTAEEKIPFNPVCVEQALECVSEGNAWPRCVRTCFPLLHLPQYTFLALGLEGLY